MGGPAESMVPSGEARHGRQGHRSLVPIGLDDLVEEAFPLIAEDLRAARVGLGIASPVAAKRAKLDPTLYRALEEGSVVRNADNVGLMMSAAQRQRIYVVGDSEAPGSFKVVPWGEVTKPTPSETAWVEISVDAKNASKGYRGYNGVMFTPPGTQSLPVHPVFVKELELQR